MKTITPLATNTPLKRMVARLRTACATRLLLLLLLALPATVHAQYECTTNNGTITITQYIGPDGAVTIPSTINGLPVASIGDYAFGAIGVTSVTIPNSVTNIGSHAFALCTTLTNVTIPNSVTGIGGYAFAYCTGLTSVTIPNSVTGIGVFAFSDCTSLAAITVDALNSFYSSVDGVLFDKSQTTLIQFPVGKAGSYTIPDSVTNIGDYAFSDCTSLASVTIPNSDTSIGAWAFSSCTSLTSVTIGHSVTSIGGWAFVSCTNLTSVTIPNSATNIGTYAFSSCTSLTSVTIGNSVTSIGDGAFESCASLTSVAIPNSVTSIGGGAFASCASLASVTIPGSVINIGNTAFLECISLASITIPNSVTSIGGRTFYGCTGLAGVYFQGNAPGSGINVFFNDTNATVYYLPGTTGWDTTFGDRPTALWSLPNPVILTSGSSFGVQTNGFGFIISWATNLSVVVEACTNLVNPAWSPMGTNTLTGGSSYFSDSQWTNYPARFYRLRSP